MNNVVWRVLAAVGEDDIAEVVVYADTVAEALDIASAIVLDTYEVEKEETQFFAFPGR